MSAAVPDWVSILDRTERGARPTLRNAVAVLQHDPTFGPEFLWYDEHLDRVFIARGHAPREWRDEDDYSVTVYMQENCGLVTIPDSIVGRAILMVAKQRRKNCVKDWAESLAWDGEARIAHALEDHWGVQISEKQPSDYVRAVSANLFIGLVARIMKPGCKVDEMVVFEGPQGARKSTALQVLAGDWFGSSHERVTDKDFYQDIQGLILVEIAELSAFSRAQIERVKHAISTPTDRYRGSYDRRSSDHPRRCVFAGTTNRDDWGQDDTGLRRFWPIIVGDITLASLKSARPQLFAEALVQFRAGATWWEVPDVAKKIQAERQDYDEWTGLVLRWCDLQLAQGEDRVQLIDVLAGPLKMDPAHADMKTQKRVGSILSLAGWRRVTARPQGGGKPTKSWFPPDSEQLLPVVTSVCFEG